MYRPACSAAASNGSIVTDYTQVKPRDAEVVIAAGALLHCVGMTIHRNEHETLLRCSWRPTSSVVAGDPLRGPERSVIGRRGRARDHRPPASTAAR
jgi:hypothetical protein